MPPVEIRRAGVLNSDLTSACAIAVSAGDGPGAERGAAASPRTASLPPLPVRVGCLQPPAHRIGGFGHQLQIEMPRNVRTQSDAGREVVVALGAVDQAGEPRSVNSAPDC